MVPLPADHSAVREREGASRWRSYTVLIVLIVLLGRLSGRLSYPVVASQVPCMEAVGNRADSWRHHLEPDDNVHLHPTGAAAMRLSVGQNQKTPASVLTRCNCRPRVHEKAAF